jgi:hypothetical protein
LDLHTNGRLRVLIIDTASHIPGGNQTDNDISCRLTRNKVDNRSRSTRNSLAIFLPGIPVGDNGQPIRTCLEISHKELSLSVRGN